MSGNWDLPTPFTCEFEVNEKDIDGMGHTNNASYVIWCEQCAWRHSESLGLSIDDYRELDRGVAIQHADYDYFLPTFVNDRLIAATWLVQCDGRLRLERRFQIVHGESGQTVLRGRWNLVSVVLSTGKVTRLPAIFVATYSGAVVPIPTS
ncbi:MAG: acyl-CoA thioesterase [Gammaproteobacteria bacterium]|nr:acyl-CoA thioesterase [Pseudomonadales bacterium]MCP5345950.1 acyl-CoA thioesterase [Pseudomonadales bacterium]